MTQFTYQARDAGGKLHRGTVDAPSSQEAVRRIKADRLFPLEVKPAQRVRRKRVPVDLMIRFYNDLSDLLGAGLPLDRSLALIASGQTRRAMAKVVEELLAHVQSGGDLSTAMERQPHIFGTLAPHLIRAGESSGTLQAATRRLGEHAERRKRLVQGLAAALTYPVILLLMSLLSILVLLLYVLPKFADIFDNLQQEIPLTTKAMLLAGEFLREWGFVLPLLFLLVWIGGGALLRDPGLNLAFQRRLVRTPLLGRLLVLRETSGFCSTLGSMLQGGVPILRGLALTEGTIGNLAVRERIEPLKERIRTGGIMSDHFREENLFPPRLSSMLRIGEEQGNVAGALLGLGAHFQEEFETALKRLMTLLEPAVIVGTGAVIAAMVLSMFSAIFGINDIQF